MSHPTQPSSASMPATVEDLPLALLEPAPDPLDFLRDPVRLGELLRLEPFDPDVQHLLADVVDQARSRFNVAAVLVNMLLNDAQVVIAKAGSAAWIDESCGTPAEWAFCAHTVRQQAPFVVTDAIHHALVKNNPLVTHDGVSSYAGVPLMASGQAIGALCVLDVEPKEFTDEDIAYLENAGREVVRRLEHRWETTER